MRFIFEVEISNDHHRMKTNIPGLARLREEVTDALCGCESIEGNAVECVSVDLKMVERGGSHGR